MELVALGRKFDGDYDGWKCEAKATTKAVSRALH
jgi:hypothetical protein